MLRAAVGEGRVEEPGRRRAGPQACGRLTVSGYVSRDDGPLVQAQGLARADAIAAQPVPELEVVHAHAEAAGSGVQVVTLLHPVGVEGGAGTGMQGELLAD